KSFSDNNIQSDIENKIKAIRDKSRTDIENIDNKDNGLRNNSQARIENKDKILNKILPNQKDDEDNIYRKIETKNKDNLIKIDVNNSESKSNVKSIYKKLNVEIPVIKAKIQNLKKQQETKKPNYWGHRDRLRNRFRDGLLKGFTDYEVLELLLFYTIGKIDTKPIAYNLINEFGSIEKVFTQSYERILSVIKKDIRPSRQECEKSAFLIKFIRQLAILLWKRGTDRKLKDKAKNITNGAQLLEYLKEYYNNYLEADMRDLAEEHFRVIFLNSSNRILKDEKMFSGTINQTSVYPREILKRALELNASSIIAVHNHPAGSIKPSNADIAVTRSLQSACDVLVISLLDHLIIGDKFYSGDQQKSFYSFAENGLL
ncbi:MAG: DNA repair protein RadC, partial [Candidatus Riflebacteria bacterium]|nr:DNA repair protein RadC [Candidatus Riflebacteria bacterium]